MSSDDVLDKAGALARLGGDEELFADMVGFLLEDAPPLFEQLQAAIAASDADVIRGRAHALKGLLGACGGVRAAERSQAMENAGSAGDVSEAQDLLNPLREELVLLMQVLEKYRR